MSTSIYSSSATSHCCIGTARNARTAGNAAKNNATGKTVSSFDSITCSESDSKRESEAVTNEANTNIVSKIDLTKSTLSESTAPIRRFNKTLIIYSIFVACVLLNGGCASRMLQLRHNSFDPLNERFQMDRLTGPINSDRTQLIKRMYNLDSKELSPLDSLVRLHQEIQRSPQAELIATYAEMAYLEGNRQEKSNPELAAAIYMSAASYAYWYLFDMRFQDARNHYDSRYRDVCLLYNGSVEKLLRTVSDQEELNLKPGQMIVINFSDLSNDIDENGTPSDTSIAAQTSDQLKVQTLLQWRQDQITLFKNDPAPGIVSSQHHSPHLNGLPSCPASILSHPTNRQSEKSSANVTPSFPIRNVSYSEGENEAIEAPRKRQEESTLFTKERNPNSFRRSSIYCRMITGVWQPNEIDSFRFSNDFEILGLENEYRQGGLGVPLIAIRKDDKVQRREERYYPPELSFPVTAFLRPCYQQTGISSSSPFVGSVNQPSSNKDIAPSSAANSSVSSSTADSPFLPEDSPDDPTFVTAEPAEKSVKIEAVLELYDPLISTYTQVGQAVVPLESDLTTPLAYSFRKPFISFINTIGLIRPDELLKPISGITESNTRTIKGLYMMQPYQPGKIPVVMVHGLWSSPMTWLEMFNTLRSIDEIRDNYQFWFYFYPSGQPFWVSAAQLRDDLAEIRQTLDPEHKDTTLDEMVLIGHSMGGLISRLQVLDSDDRFWHLISDANFSEVEMNPEMKTELKKWFFFRANPSIRRVITIATPFEGSDAANDLSKWFGQRVISIPNMIRSVAVNFIKTQSELIKDDTLLKMETSIDSLSPKCPFYHAMDESLPPENVTLNNIVGILPKYENRWISPKQSDGIVDFSSAHRTDVESEKIIPAPHMLIHTHPSTILETYRLLDEHLTEMRSENTPSLEQRP